VREYGLSDMTVQMAEEICYIVEEIDEGELDRMLIYLLESEAQMVLLST
jgi:hypothetical protein